MPINETKAYQTFRDHLLWLETDVQVIDSICNYAQKELNKKVKEDDLSPESSMSSVMGVNILKYNKLTHPWRQSRKIFNQTINRRFEYAICQLYSYFVDYLHEILFELYIKNPKKVVENLTKNSKGSNFSFDYYDVIKLGTYSALEHQMVDTVFRKLEDERDTKKLMTKILKCAGIDDLVDNKINEALQYLELRHLFVHHKGIVDEFYARVYGNLFTPALNKGHQVPRTYTTYSNAVTKISTLVHIIDQKLISTGLVNIRR